MNLGLVHPLDPFGHGRLEGSSSKTTRRDPVYCLGRTFKVCGDAVVATFNGRALSTPRDAFGSLPAEALVAMCDLREQVVQAILAQMHGTPIPDSIIRYAGHVFYWEERNLPSKDPQPNGLALLGFPPGGAAPTEQICHIGAFTIPNPATPREANIARLNQAAALVAHMRPLVAPTMSATNYGYLSPDAIYQNAMARMANRAERDRACDGATVPYNYATSLTRHYRNVEELIRAFMTGQLPPDVTVERCGDAVHLVPANPEQYLYHAKLTHFVRGLAHACGVRYREPVRIDQATIVHEDDGGGDVPQGETA